MTATLLGAGRRRSKLGDYVKDDINDIYIYTVILSVQVTILVNIVCSDDLLKVCSNWVGIRCKWLGGSGAA